MTAPVIQQQVGDNEFLVQFYMPKGWTLNTLPKPNDSRVTIKQIPERRIFADRYVGGWSENLYFKEVNEAKGEMTKEKLTIKGQPMWARYNSPMAPSFLRTNEIMYEL
jgi:hypothetical protein